MLRVKSSIGKEREEGRGKEKEILRTRGVGYKSADWEVGLCWQTVGCLDVPPATLFLTSQPGRE